MFEEIDDLVEQYRKEFETEMTRRSEERKQEAELANIGRGIADRGFRNLVKQVAPVLDLDKFEEENHKHTKRVDARVAEIEAKLQEMPEAAARRRKRHTRTMQEIAMPHLHSGCVTPPPEVIIGNADGPTDSRNRCEVTSDLDLARIYPRLFIRGTGRDAWRDSEVTCDYLWFFTTDRTERHYVTPHIEYHGSRVFAGEYHCFHDTDADANIQVLMDVNQDRWMTPADEVSSFQPPHGRLDTWRWPNHEVYLVAGRRTYVVVRVRITASARSKYGTSVLNFGNPTSDNFIGIPYLCWLGGSEI